MGSATVTLPAADGPLDAQLDACIDRAVARLLEMQHADGYWWAELESNVTMASEHLLLEQFLGIADAGRWRKIVNYLLKQQQADGSWPIYYGGPGDVSVTTEAYFALKVAGVDAASPEMARARDWVRAHGGIGATRVFTKLWLSLFGQFDWRAMPAMPPEAILLPLSSPVNIYEFASWARATIVPILVVWAARPLAPLPPGVSVDELYVDPADRRRVRHPRARRPLSARNVFLALDAALKAHERSPWKPLRRRALRACERWILEHQEADGSWGGIQPPWVYSLIALKCLGYAPDHPVMARGIHGLLHDFALETDETFTVQPCVSPVWDTALAVIGLREAGVPASHPALLRAARWLLAREVRAAGDWTRKVRGIAPGGWPFEFANEQYPDTDDTAEVLMALRLLDVPDEAAPAASRAMTWLRAMQSSNGGWGAFDRDNMSTLVTRIPFCDFGAVIDPPSEDVTAHIVEMFALAGVRHDDAMMRKAIDYLWSAQEEDGSWFGRWGVNHIYGTAAVVPALVAAGVPFDDPRIARALGWIRAHQNDDGGWGETCASYDDPALRGRGPSTASQTAWALLALLAGEAAGTDDAVRRGIRYLIETQAPDGEWHEPYFTGTGFPHDFMLKYHLYRNYWPLWALGRYRRALHGTPVHLPRTKALA
ncbi:MAG TPA: squalene--hopene cyclase [Dehalococcoidia bacterium]|nr:squalene--hopene cyclase [Dehalococcoidia bacterium]